MTIPDFKKRVKPYTGIFCIRGIHVYCLAKQAEKADFALILWA